MTVHFDRPKFDRPLYLRSELSRIREVPGEAPLSRLFTFSLEIFPQYQHDSLSTLQAAFSVRRSMILCSVLSQVFLFVFGFFKSRRLNFRTCVFSSVLSGKIFTACSTTQLTSDPHECASRISGARIIHGPQYSDRTCDISVKDHTGISTMKETR